LIQRGWVGLGLFVLLDWKRGRRHILPVNVYLKGKLKKKIM